LSIIDQIREEQEIFRETHPAKHPASSPFWVWVEIRIHPITAFNIAEAYWKIPAGEQQQKNEKEAEYSFNSSAVKRALFSLFGMRLVEDAFQPERRIMLIYAGTAHVFDVQEN